MVDFGKSDKMVKICGKVDKSNTYNGFRSNILFFIQGRTFQTKTVEKLGKILSEKVLP